MVDFDFEIAFSDGVVHGEDCDADALLVIADILRQKAAGVSHAAVRLDGSTRLLADIRSINVKAVW